MKLSDAESKLLDEMCSTAWADEKLREGEVVSLTRSLDAAKVAHATAAQRAKDITAFCEKLRKEPDKVK